MASTTIPRTRLTKRLVDGWEFIPGTTEAGKPIAQIFYWDSELKGFGLRITAGGVKSYVVQGRVNGTERRLTIGRHGPFTVEQARHQAGELLRGMRLGTDPQEERAKKKALSVTLREVTDAYILDRELKPRSVADIERHVTKSFGDWELKPVIGITRDACKRRFGEMSKTGPQQANQAFRVLRALLKYARAVYRTDEGPLLPENPVEVLNDASLWNKETARTGRIPTERIGAVWSMLQTIRADETTKVDHIGADYLSFLMLTGSRKSAAAELTWDRVKLTEDSGTWHIPKEFAKNGRAVTFPLCAAAREILVARLKRRPEDVKFVFNTWGKHGHVTNVTGMIQKVSEVAGAPITLHDLRRTFAAIADKAGVPYVKAKLLMHHTMGHDVTIKHYTDTENLHESCTAEAEAIGAWIAKQADQFDAIAAGRNVVPIRA